MLYTYIKVYKYEALSVTLFKIRPSTNNNTTTTTQHNI